LKVGGSEVGRAVSAGLLMELAVMARARFLPCPARDVGWD